jgi:hypothetical protein
VLDWFSMGFLDRIVGSHREISRLRSECEEAAEQVHRLEIALRRLTERVEDVEGRHAELSGTVRGRLGGRPRKSDAVPPSLLPLGAQHLHPGSQE